MNTRDHFFYVASLSLKNFCGFREFASSLGRMAVLIGPNNGGKTTILRAISFVADCLDLSRGQFEQSLRQFDGKLDKQRAAAKKAEDDLRVKIDQRRTKEMTKWVDMVPQEKQRHEQDLKQREANELRQMQQQQEQAAGRILNDQPNWACTLSQAVQRQNIEDSMSLYFEHSSGQRPSVRLVLTDDIESIEITCTIAAKDQVSIACKFKNQQLLELRRDERWQVLDWLRGLDVSFVHPMSALIPSEQALSWPQVKQKLDQGRPHEVWRNQLHWLYEGKQPSVYQKVIDRIEASLGTVSVNPPSRTRDQQPKAVLRYDEEGREYDIAESGAGLRTLLNITAHVEMSTSSILLLDEPDSHLHSGVQKEIADFLESQATEARQIIIATHAPDMIEQFSVSSLLWIDRHENSARICDDVTKTLLDLGAISRSQAASFAGKDVLLYFEDVPDRDVLSGLMHRLGKDSVLSRCETARLRGSGDAPYLAGVARLIEDHSKRKVAICVILDSDYHGAKPGGVSTQGAVLTCRLPCKELENLLLMQPAAIASAARRRAEKRASATGETIESPTEDQISQLIDTETLKPEVRRKVENNWVLAPFSNKPDPGQLSQAQDQFRKHWESPDFRRRLCPGKLVLRGVKRELQQKHRISFPSLQSIFACYEPGEEVGEIFDAIEAHIASVLAGAPSNAGQTEAKHE